MAARRWLCAGVLGFVSQLLLSSHALAGCGDEPQACETSLGTYHAALPALLDEAPVLVFLHGYGSSGGNAIALNRMVQPALDRGYAVLAPDGLTRSTDGTGPASWNFFPGWPGRDEVSFLTDVVQDAAKRFGVDPETVLLAGFSAGGFMVNYLACSTPEAFNAYAPVAGGFWRPHPEVCAGPVRLFHTHGWADSTVPLEGRLLGGGRFQQGDIFAGLEIWRAANACADEKPSGYSETEPFLRRLWEDCAPGSALEMALFPGGHTVPEGWVDMALDWFEGPGAGQSDLE
ncbi:MAG: alpha/beta fold hydrolase [Pseudomonadota bacterium]